MKRFFKIAVALAALALFLAGYTAAMARVGSGTAPDMAPKAEQADALRVDKSERRLDLLRNGEAIASYAISLGAAPEGHKGREGDERTPTGDYVIDWRNPNSIAHLSLHISYPNEADRARAAEAGVSPGGDIMIHGLPNGWGWLGAVHLVWDWTNGCIAVTDAQMREIWSLVPDGTPITITE
ncbi:L,D-transpeptidase family protein [Vannielia litorea]|uniref:L,D-transpeptidase catalytic domain n=1 Tax=Vannielia litorea TaxID=1217970 RepID=A0A1N6HC43_9RHOB|nr:L,D-transpeptidase family protein [Vannielia litorea]SIO17340.1 L,D-transpeptidase catalytic domain [Vannielia litorea]